MAKPGREFKGGEGNLVIVEYMGEKGVNLYLPHQTKLS
jgi:hypothetical protein